MSRRVQGGIGVGVDLPLSKGNVSDSWCGSLLDLRIKDLIFRTHTECYWQLWDFIRSFHIVHETEAGFGRQTLLRSMFWINIFWRNVFFVVVEKAVEEALQEEARRCARVPERRRAVRAAGCRCRVQGCRVQGCRVQRCRVQRCRDAFPPPGGAEGCAAEPGVPALPCLELGASNGLHESRGIISLRQKSPLLWLSFKILLILAVSG